MKLFWYFYFYSFLGFLLEVVYARVIGLKKVDRKCRLLLPLCPVYGIGATAIVSLPQTIQSSPILLFFAGGILATLSEYLAALFYEKVWRVKFWDYTTLPGNLQGRVCLPFSLIWGALAVLICHSLHPGVAQFISDLPNGLLVPLTLVYAVDLVLTGCILRQTNSTSALRWYLV